MCGILGYYNIDHSVIDREKEEIIALRDQMIHRGPDSGGYLEAAQRNWILAHRRLAILDLSKNGNQPMSDIDKKIHISYNGEIYNFKDLRYQLNKKRF